MEIAPIGSFPWQGEKQLSFSGEDEEVYDVVFADFTDDEGAHPE